MIELSVIDMDSLSEGGALEVKKAAGRDGTGEVPRSFFESYSAMANTNGGTIILGIEEHDRRFHVHGIQDVARVQKQLWDGLNDRNQISVNLLADKDVSVAPLEGKQVIKIRVPRAGRKSRPVYVGKNPLAGTFRRNFEGDYRCDEETVKRMLAEQIEDARDGRLLENFGIDDLDPQSLGAYRNQFRATKPDHPWITLDDKEFLRSIGAWTRDRDSGCEGLTLGGVLMFGRLRSILDAVPNYVVDYQERAVPRNDPQWIDRVTTDGTWSGNLFDFYRTVIAKLTKDLKVPFRLEGTSRVDQTRVHEALREALVNTLIHADYSGRVSILVVKRPDMFGFRNPGTMRIPAEEAVRGGRSDCRNRNLQKMFQLGGLGEQAGSGIPRLIRNWQEQHWRPPDLWDTEEPVEETLVAMRMVSLLPEETLAHLDRRFGPSFRLMTELERLALATVDIEGKVTNVRLQSMSDAHPSDITKVLSSLVRRGMLNQGGATRGTYYFFPGEPPVQELDGAAGRSGELPFEPTESSEQKSEQSSEHFALGSEQKKLESVAASVRTKKRVPAEVMEATLLELCSGRWLSLKELARLLGRSPDTLRVHYLSDLVNSGRLELKFPDKPNHPDQAYRQTLSTSPG